MAAQEMTAVKQLPLHGAHQALGAKFGAFGEWEVPLYYSSILAEHEAVRNGVGIFDVSHMGEIFVNGAQARRTLDYWLTNRMARLIPGKALYSPMCNEKGGIVDDLVVFQLSDESYLAVVNASNVQKDHDWFLTHNKFNADVVNESEATGLLSVQGPKSGQLVTEIFPDARQLTYYSVMRSESPWPGTIVSRTGYTGEMGFEIFVRMEFLEALWSALFEKGKRYGVVPAGFGARDTLRLESCMLLYGQDMDEGTTPLEAGIDWAVSFDKDFFGKEALATQKAKGVARKLAAFQMSERGLARHGYDVYRGSSKVGHVASGTFAPTLKQNIGLAYVSAEQAGIGSQIEIGIRDKKARATVVKMPFYTHRTKGSL